jgi:putative NADH-flavin reductase
MTSLTQLSIAILGATGNLGAKIRDEALQRGHSVAGIVRHPDQLPVAELLTARAADTHAVDDLADAFTGHDLAIISIRWNSNDIDDVLSALRSARMQRAILVVGAGSLLMPDGRLAFEHNRERGVVAPTSEAALQAYRRIREVTDLALTAVSPSMRIEPGERTGFFRTGGDFLLTDALGDSRISQEDFAVAILDEAENPQHPGSRFTVGY